MSLADDNHKKSVLSALLRTLETHCSILLAVVAGVVVFVCTLGPVHDAYNPPLRTKFSEFFQYSPVQTQTYLQNHNQSKEPVGLCWFLDRAFVVFHQGTYQLLGCSLQYQLHGGKHCEGKIFHRDLYPLGKEYYRL